MADTVTFQSSTLATVPDTTVIATDDAGAAGHVQVVKLAISTNGSATPLTADNTDGLLVNLGANNDVTVTGTVTATQATAANLNVTEASAAAIKTAVETIDNAISGSEMQVDVVGALPAGTNAIGKLAANSGVDIGDVDVTSIAAGDNNIGNVDIVTLPAKKLTYAASAALTQTNLDGLASSATWVAGWESAAIDNSSNLYIDYRINAVLQLESTGTSAGEARMYLVAEQSDSTWPDVFDGTESTETITDTEERDSICRLAARAVNDTTASAFVYLQCPSVAAVFNGTCPRKFVVFITQSSGNTLETTGDPNQVYVAGVYLT